MYDTCFALPGAEDGSEVVTNAHRREAATSTSASVADAESLQAGGYRQVWGLSPTQLAVLEPPYALRIDRPFLARQPDSQSQSQAGPDSNHDPDARAVEVRRRAPQKKAHDRRVFGAEYF